MIPDMVLNASMYAPLTKLLDISNYRVVSTEIWIHMVISTRNYAYRINTVRFVYSALSEIAPSVGAISRSRPLYEEPPIPDLLVLRKSY